ncbi:hypothetical protein AAMO2058_000288500 [Amorphochlora amoebiformis]
MKGVLLPLVLICSAATCLFSASNVKMMRARPVGRMRFFPKIVNFAKLRPQAGIRSVRKGGGIPSMRHEIGGGVRVKATEDWEEEDGPYGVWEDADEDDFDLPEDEMQSRDESVDTTAFKVIDSQGREVSKIRYDGSDEFIKKNQDIVNADSQDGIFQKALKDGWQEDQGWDDLDEDDISQEFIQNHPSNIKEDVTEETIKNLQESQDTSRYTQGGLANAIGIRKGGELDQILDDIVKEDEMREIDKENEAADDDGYQQYLRANPELQDYLQTPEDDLDKEISNSSPTSSETKFVESTLVDEEGMVADEKSLKEKLEAKDYSEALEDEDIQKQLLKEFDWDDDIAPEEERALLQDEEDLDEIRPEHGYETPMANSLYGVEAKKEARQLDNQRTEGLDDFIADVWNPTPGEWVKVIGLEKSTEYNGQIGQIVSQNTTNETPSPSPLTPTKKLEKSKNEKEFLSREKERYTVLLSKGKRLSVRKRNLELTLDPEKAEEARIERESRRRAEKLFQKLALAGKDIERVIDENVNHIDETLLNLIKNRVEFEEKQYTVDKEGVKGLVLLYKRLKKVYDRIHSTPSLRLLDDCLELMQIQPGSQNQLGSLGDISLDERDESVALMEVNQKLRNAFYGTEELDRSLGGEGDLFSLAQIVQTQGGRQLVDEMFENQVEAETFLKETGQVLELAQEEGKKLGMLLEEIKNEMKKEDEITNSQMSQLQHGYDQVMNEMEERKRILRCIAKIMRQAEILGSEKQSRFS